jgi:uncharacterized protein YdaU (DUF1376 family)
MNDKELTEYSQWMWRDTFKMTLRGVGIYVVLLAAYWLTIGYVGAIL